MRNNIRDEKFFWWKYHKTQKKEISVKLKIINVKFPIETQIKIKEQFIQKLCKNIKWSTRHIHII